MPDRNSPLAVWVQPLLGGPDGAHTRVTPRDGRIRARVILGLLGVMGLLGVLIQAPCMGTAWSDEASSYAHLCHSPLIAQYLDPSLATGLGGTAWAALLGWVAALSGASAWSAVSYASLVAMINLIGFALAGLALLRLTAVPWRVLAFALSPVVVFTVVHSFDPLAIGFALWGVIGLIEGRNPMLGGVLFALAAAINPLALLVAAGVLLGLWAQRSEVPGRQASGHALRQSPQAQGQNPQAPGVDGSSRRTHTLLFAAAFAVPAVVMLGLDSRLGEWLPAWFQVRAEDGSPMGILAQLGVEVPAAAATVVAVFGILALVIVIALLLPSMTLRGGSVPVLAPATALLAGAALLLPSASLSFSLWLLPFAVLTVPHWGIQLPWMAAELLFAGGQQLYLLDTRTEEAGLPAHIFGPVCVLRLVAIVVIGVAAMRGARAPGGARPASAPPAEPEGEGPAPDGAGRGLDSSAAGGDDGPAPGGTGDDHGAMSQTDSDAPPASAQAQGPAGASVTGVGPVAGGRQNPV